MQSHGRLVVELVGMDRRMCGQGASRGDGLGTAVYNVLQKENFTIVLREADHVSNAKCTVTQSTGKMIFIRLRRCLAGRDRN